MRINRRQFLRGSAQLGLGSMAPMGWLAEAANAASGKSVVLITLAGGVDALSVLVPYGDDAYYRARPRIAIAGPRQNGGVLRLDDYFGLAPALAALLPFWQAGTLAFAPAVGSPLPMRGHFEAQNWLRDGQTAMAPLAARDFPAHAARLAASLGKDPDINAVSLTVGGWDTHADQGGAAGRLAANLRPVAQGLAILAQMLGRRFQDCLILVTSEFGRSLRENEFGGTDHGYGGAVWLLGGAVAGGRLLGTWPGLTDADLHQGRDLAVTENSRDLLQRLARAHCGGSAPSAVTHN
jgi:uncharacterized protein (DUF1501 family)